MPERAALEARSLVRTRGAMVKKQTRCKNQIKGMLSMYGISIPERLEKSHWSRRFIQWLENLAMHEDSGNQALLAYLTELHFLRQIIAQLTRQIRSLSHQEPYRTPVTYHISVFCSWHWYPHSHDSSDRAGGH